MHTTLNKKNPDMLALEQSFTSLKSNKDSQGDLRSIARILKRQFDLDFTVTVTDNKTKQFFGMSIYPGRNLIDQMVDQLINKKPKLEVLEELWSKNKVWHLEIDDLLLEDARLNANPAEMVAVLLHEIGHVVYSNTVPARLNKVVRYEMLSLSFKMKKLLEWRKAQRLFDLVIIEASSTKNYHTQALKREVDADKFVVKMGYGDKLEEFVAKLLSAQGNALIDRTEKDMEKDIKAVLTWSLVNINELEYRKQKLRTMLQTEILMNPSVYVRGVVYDIKSVFFGGSDEDNYKNLITEQYLVNEMNTVVKEGFFDLFDKLGKVKKISQSDIDIIEVEKDRISNDDDKIYVLDLIYDKLDRINAGLELIEKKSSDKLYSSKDTLLRQKAQLEKLRKDTLAVRTKDKQYGVFIQYPKGYEG